MTGARGPAPKSVEMGRSGGACGLRRCSGASLWWLGASAALVGAATFALFTSTADPQADTFTAGTVILSSTSGNDACGPQGIVLSNLEPGDSGTCTYTVTYTGTLNAWVSLDVNASAVALSAYTPSGSQTPIGGEALLNNGGDVHGLSLSVSDTMGNFSAGNPNNPSDLMVPLVTCPSPDSSPAEGTGALGSATACNGTADGQLLANNNNAGDNGSNNAPDGSWAPGQSDTVTLSWQLPLTAPNTYQGSSAQIVLQANAVQASNTTSLSFFSGDNGAYATWSQQGTPPGIPWHIVFSNPSPTGTTYSGATINTVSGLTMSQITALSFMVDTSGYVGAGAPRFSIILSDGVTLFPSAGDCGVSHNPSGGWVTVNFMTCPIYGSSSGSPQTWAQWTSALGNPTIDAVYLVQDEGPGTAELANVIVNQPVLMP